MWIKIINKKRFAYDTYKEAYNDINSYEIYFDGLFFIKKI